jgi:hypothetical protein
LSALAARGAEAAFGGEATEFFGFSWDGAAGEGEASAGAAVALGAKAPRASKVTQTTAEHGFGRRILNFVTAERELVKS